MTTEERLNEASKLLQQARGVGRGTFELVVIGTSLMIRERHGRNRPLPCLCRLNSIELNECPTSEKWDYIKGRLCEFQKKGILS